MKYRLSFYEHGCKEEYVDRVMDYDMWYPLHESERNNEQVMDVGWDREICTLWEIGIEWHPEGQEDWIFHAQPATVYSKKQVNL